MEGDGKICNFMDKVLSSYNLLRGKYCNDLGLKFWDAVVLSSSDHSQKVAYEQQIKKKQKRLELPLGVPFHIFSDPIDCKIGCGGSAMLILEKLAEIYGEKLQKMHILFIPAGGYSQRLPNHSVLGKLFAPVPIKDFTYELIDLILAVYVPFLEKMIPGVFLACSDSVISFYLDEKDVWSFESPGFTALAHPSTIEIGENHGVYVIPPVLSNDATSFMTSCVEVLQKPSKSLMEEKGAIIKVNGKEIVFTDSAFFFDMDVGQKLLKFFKKVKPLDCEISSYGDFLQPLGTAANSNYIQSADLKLTNLRMQLFKLLNKIPLNVLVLKKSAFYHLGTGKEYIDNFCIKSQFSKHFSCKNFVHSAFYNKNHSFASLDGVVLFSALHSKCFISEHSVVEYCDFSIPVYVSSYSIISNCKLSKSDWIEIPLVIPCHVLFHTIPLLSGYVTICFSLDENLKQNCETVEALKLIFLNSKLENLQKQIFRKSLFDKKDRYVSLWHANLFPVCHDMEESFLKTLSLVQDILGIYRVKSEFTNYNNCHFISMKEILKSKNEKELLRYREELSNKIHSMIDC